MALLIVAALASLMRGGRYVHDEAVAAAAAADGTAEPASGVTAVNGATAAAGSASDGSASDGSAADGERERNAVRAVDGRATPDA
jgi:hypothetical protein